MQNLWSITYEKKAGDKMENEKNFTRHHMRTFSTILVFNSLLLTRLDQLKKIGKESR